MKIHLLPLYLLLLLAAVPAVAEDDLPKTFMTTRGRLLMSEDFSKPLPSFTGKPVGFASGFAGWLIHGGTWEVSDSAFRGCELAEKHHPASASYGFDFQDVVVQCDLRLEDVPLVDRRSRYLQLKATDEKDYVCVLTFGQWGLNGRSYDDTRINPRSHQREESLVPAQAPLPVKLGEWHTVVLEIKGDEVVGTLDHQSLTYRQPLIANTKHSIMFCVASEGSFRKVRIWEALPNPDWPKNKASLATVNSPASR